MLDQAANDFIDQGKKFRFQFTTSSSLEIAEKGFLHLLKRFPKDPALLFYYNEFRIANAERLPRSRPQILVGAPINGRYPNLHTYPLLEVADVVSLSCAPVPLGYHSSIHCNTSTPFFHILNQLPKGFNPDFYWDNQTEKRHFIPKGIEMAPFPLVASVCHSFLHLAIEHICELFDYVIPLNTFEASLLRKKYPDKILDFPFGLNWGSFDDFIQPLWNKSVDIAVTFGKNNTPQYGEHRNIVIDKMREFQKKFQSKYKIEFIDNQAVDLYVDLLRNSLITINVTGVHGPYNYRTVEALCAGSLVFQYDWNDGFFNNQFEGLFKDGIHGIGFTLENLESKLLYYLEHRHEALKIAKEGYRFLIENYTYQKLYLNLVDFIKKNPIKLPRQVQNATGYHHSDMIYFNQSKLLDIKQMSFGSLAAYHETPWIQLNNYMVLLNLYQDLSLSDLYITTLLDNPLQDSGAKSKKELTLYLYQEGIKKTPQEFKWILEWNFFLQRLEDGEVTLEEFKKIIELLEKESPTAFPEERVIFKYYLESSDYPEYNIERSSLECLFMQFNLDIKKVIDKPQERAKLYLQYALNAAKSLRSTRVEHKL